MFLALRHLIEAPREYTSHHLRLQVVYNLIVHADLLMPEVIGTIRENYTGRDGDPGPFSYAQYCEHIMVSVLLFL